MDYKEVKDYPMDVYFLIDDNKSMAKEITKLSALSQLLVESFREITADFQIGYGLTNNAFQNKMSLNVDASRFSVSF